MCPHYVRLFRNLSPKTRQFTDFASHQGPGKTRGRASPVVSTKAQRWIQLEIGSTPPLSLVLFKKSHPDPHITFPPEILQLTRKKVPLERGPGASKWSPNWRRILRVFKRVAWPPLASSMGEESTEARSVRVRHQHLARMAAVTETLLSGL